MQDRCMQGSRKRNMMAGWFSVDEIDEYFILLENRDWKSMKNLCRCEKNDDKTQICPACHILKMKEEFGLTKNKNVL